jgi:hypothetical protein
MAKSNAAGVTNTLVGGAVIIGAILLIPRIAKAATAAKGSATPAKSALDTLFGRPTTAQTQPQSSSPKLNASGSTAPLGQGNVGANRSLVPSVTTQQLQALGSTSTNRNTFGDGLLGGPLVVEPSVSTSELQSLGGSTDYFSSSLLDSPFVAGPSVDIGETQSSFGDIFSSFGDLFSGEGAAVEPSADPFDVSFGDSFDWGSLFGGPDVLPPPDNADTGYYPPNSGYGFFDGFSDPGGDDFGFGGDGYDDSGWY